jgi:microcystin-dependent protein
MSDQFVAEIRIFPFNFAPTGWAFCNGQLLPISQNTALFSLLGTTYGGDGKSTFALPNMQGSAPMQQGQGQGLSLRDLGEQSGVDSITLIQSEMPLHNHTLGAQNVPLGSVALPSATTTLDRPASGNLFSSTITPIVQMDFNALGVTGSSLPHNNLQPYLTLNFCIALQGIFPPRSAPTKGGPTRGGIKTQPIGVMRDE